MRTKPTTENSIELIRNGYEYIQTYLDLISRAENFILLHTYIFEVDETTKPILKEIISAASRKVRVFILLDAFGSQNFPEKTINELIAAGVEIAFFTPFLHFYRQARRMHQKLLLVDNKQAIVGGINLARRFNNPDQEHPWLDYSILLEGSEVHNVYLKSLRHYLKYFPRHKDKFLEYKALSFKSKNRLIAKSIENDWIYQYKEVTQSYNQAIKNANEKVVIMATYFLPGKKLLKLLRKASRNDIEVTLIFGAFSDHKWVQRAERYFFDWYLQSGFNIYLWDRSIVHGKLALIDSDWVSIGSYNHNFLSKFGNCELNIEIINHDFNQKVENEIKNILKSCQKVEERTLKKDSFFVGFFTYLLLNVLTLFSLIFLYRQSDEDQEIISR